MANTAENISIQAVRNLLGDHPEDVISPIKNASDALIWIEEILITIKKEALNEHNGYRIKHLAEAGAYIAGDMGNYAGHMHEIYLDRLQSASIVNCEKEQKNGI